MRKIREAKSPPDAVPINAPGKQALSLRDLISPLPKGVPGRYPRLYPDDAPITEERIINAMKVVAYIMSSRPDGAKFAPIFERLERELEAFRVKNAPVERARQFLERYTSNISASTPHKPEPSS